MNIIIRKTILKRSSYFLSEDFSLPFTLHPDGCDFCNICIFACLVSMLHISPLGTPVALSYLWPPFFFLACNILWHLARSHLSTRESAMALFKNKGYPLNCKNEVLNTFWDRCKYQSL